LVEGYADKELEMPGKECQIPRVSTNLTRLASIVAIALSAILPILSGCTQTSTAELQPIQGSITYGGLPRQHLLKAPIGSQVPHTFTDQWGDRVRETYIIQPDRSLKLVNRVYLTNPY
jgi:hypothetical protein